MFFIFLAAIISVTSVNDSYPDGSPDGTKLAFQSDRSGNLALWLAKADGSSPELIYEGGSLGTNPVTPKFSPDGQSIVFAMVPADNRRASDIYLLTLADRSVRRLTRDLGDASHPVWDRSGARIYFNADRRIAPANESQREWSDIFSMTPDGTDLRQHTRCEAVCTYPAPSPDGKFLAYRKIVDGPGKQWNQQAAPRNSEVVVAPLLGGSELNLSRHQAFDGWPTWSPDSKWIAFSSNRQGQPSVGQIYLVRPDGSGLRPVTEGPLSHAQPSFSTDGRTMYFYELLETDEFGMGHIAKLNLGAAK